MAPIETILEALCAGQMSLPEAAAILAQASRQNPELSPQRMAVVESYLAEGHLSPEWADRLKSVLIAAEPGEKRTLFRPPGSTGGATGSGGIASGAVAVSTGAPVGGKTGSQPQPIQTGSASSGTFSDWPPPTSGNEPPVTVGTILRDRFYIQEVVGAGGMGVVFRALDRRREEAQDRHPHVAIKVLGEEFKNHPDALVALQREARRMQQLSHPSIAAVYDFDRDGSHVYLVMELLEGNSLDHILAGLAGRGMGERDALQIISGAGEALSFAHSRGVVHSDFKPANVFVMSDGDVKVFDFGIARIAKDSAQAGDAAHTIFDAGKLGAMTNAYASPEQILDTAAPDPRDDVYAFGLVAYEVLSGRHPFERKSAVEAQHRGMTVPPIDALSDRQNKALASALSFSREDRLGDVMSLVESLSESDVDRVGKQIIVPPRDGGARPARADHTGSEQSGKGRGLAIAAGVAIVALALGGYWFATQRDRGVAASADAGAVSEPVLPSPDSTPRPVAGDSSTGDGPAVPALPGAAPQEAAQANGNSPPAAARINADTRPEAAVQAAGAKPDLPPEAPIAAEQAAPGEPAKADVPVEQTVATVEDRSPAPPAPPAGGPGLYRWVDESGEVQFGENPPAKYADSAVKVMDLE